MIARFPALGRIPLLLMKRFGLFTRAERAFALLVPAVGLLTGLVAVLIIGIMALVENLLWGKGTHILAAARAAGPEVRFLAPLVGGLGIALTMLFARTRFRSGTSSLIEAVALRGGYIPTRHTLLTQLAAILTVGSGGSAGREGPLAMSGASVASKLGRVMDLKGNALKILVGCGTAAGMAAAYNAPVGGAIFAMEVILGNFALDTFGPIVISSVLATLISRHFLFPGGHSVYDVPAYTLTSPGELVLFAMLGVLAGGLAVLFILCVSWGDRLFERSRLPGYLQPIVGFALVGLIGVYSPYVYGNGFDTVNLALHQQLPLALLLLLPFLKLVATSVTIGSGGVGGLFTPSLLVGSLLGGAFGLQVHHLFPTWTGSSGAYALVGMGAIAAGTTHAPISAILIVYEITQNYSIILPLMAACIMSNLVSRALKKESIFTQRLKRRGIRLPHRLEEIVMENLHARDVLREDPLVLAPTDSVPRILDRFLETRRNHLYVLDGDQRFLGAVSLHDLKRVLLQSRDLDFILAVDVMHADFPCVRVSNRLSEVLEVFAQYDHERLPVLQDGDSRTFVGILSKRDIIAVYNQEVLQRPSLLAKFTTEAEDKEEPTFVELPPHYRVAQVAAGPRLARSTLQELDLSNRFQIQVLELLRVDASLRELRVMPRGGTELAEGDRLIVIGRVDRIAALREWSRGEPPPPDAAEG